MKKRWKTLVYQGEVYNQFKISDYGDLMNAKTGHIYKLRLGKTGYLCVCVSLGSRKNKKTFKLHKGVAETFIPNPDNLPVVNHKDGIKTNNFVGNLEWCTYQENSIHAVKIGLIDTSKNSGSNHCNSKFSEEDVRWIRKHYIPRHRQYGTRALSRKFEVHHRTIEDLVNRQTYRDV